MDLQRPTETGHDMMIAILLFTFFGHTSDACPLGERGEQ